VGIQASTANSHSSLVSLGLGAIVGLTILALLCSNQELAVFGTWDIWLRAIVVATLLAFPPLLGALAWTLTRRTFRRFDEWVGRPQRGSHSQAGLTGISDPVHAHV
jgi:hypothetical protein